MESSVEFLVAARWVLPVQPGGILEHHAVVVRDGRIVALLPTNEARAQFPHAPVTELGSHVLIPGFINAHTHAAMSLLRGMADDLPLMEWLKGHIWPAEGRWLSPDFVRDGTELAIAEMLLGGTTCFSDMYLFPDVTARVCSRLGMRASIGMVLFDFPTPWAQDADEYIRKGLAMRDEFKSNSALMFPFAPHAPYTVSDESFRSMQRVANELDIPVHTHLHETAAEVEEAIAKTGKRPLARFEELGLLGPGLMVAHMTQLEDDEIRKIAEYGVHVLHCPESNLKLASGFCPVERLREAGVNVALGTDGAASNNDLDMLGEMRSMALLAKGVSGKATAIDAATALEIATLGGARALGLEDEVGSLEVGKWADMVAVDLSAPATSPVYNPVSQLVYAASRDQVSHVWIAGRPKVENGRLRDMDQAGLVRKADKWRQRITGVSA
ncbi:MAG: TRZ/ATZ family hydrolase [Proteobacteria bacterium]|nr:TRZ/ATZ family hydrolase [Pseudomonadota bacterium]